MPQNKGSSEPCLTELVTIYWQNVCFWAEFVEAKLSTKLDIQAKTICL